MQEFLRNLKLLIGWLNIDECSNKWNAYAIFIKAFRTRTEFIPSASFIHVSIAANQKIITNVVPSAWFHMKFLKAANAIWTNGDRIAIFGCRMRDDDTRCRRIYSGQRICWRSSKPLGPTSYSQSMLRIIAAIGWRWFISIRNNSCFKLKLNFELRILDETFCKHNFTVHWLAVTLSLIHQCR